jgi:N-acetylmuramoyl-L-alanine amidase
MTREEFGKLLNLETDHIPVGKKNRSGKKIEVEYLTVHNTDNDNKGADAHAHAKFVKNTGYYVLPSGKRHYVSWHYSVDDIRIVNHLPVKERAIHAGSTAGNSKSIGIEICMNKGIDQAAANLRAARLVAALLYDLKIQSTEVVPHYHWSKKNCPRLLLNNGKPGTKWDDFIQLIQQELARID